MSGDWDLAICKRAFPGYSFTREAGQIVARMDGCREFRDSNYQVVLSILHGRHDPEQVEDARCL